MGKINIKPLSVNQAWQGKRFKTPEYKSYSKEVLLKLPVIDIPADCFLIAFYEFGVSNMCSDVDNLVKCFQDQLQTKYGFKDHKIMEFKARKVKVKKGSEYINFELQEYKTPYQLFSEWMEWTETKPREDKNEKS